MGSSESNKRIWRRIVEDIFNTGRIPLSDELVAEHFVEHGDLQEMGSGREGFKGCVQTLRAAIPDLHLAAEDMIAEGDRVAARMTLAGTFHSDFLHLTATRGRTQVPVLFFLRFARGQLVESWCLVDRTGLNPHLETPDQKMVAL